MQTEKLKTLLNDWADGRPPRGASERFLSASLRAASAAYRAGSAAHSLVFDLGIRRARRVGCPVICIGNLSVGGTGKTPLVAWAARHFRDAGRRVAIVSRGYRRWESSNVLLVSDGEKILTSADRAGDEPFLLAKTLDGVAVAVGADRCEAARLALERCNANLILLDDGFQHRGLARDCDIVLWDALRPPEAAAFLPRGFLREGLGALRRAHALVFTRCNLGEVSRPFLHKIKRIAPHLLIFQASLMPGKPWALGPRDASGLSGMSDQSDLSDRSDLPDPTDHAKPASPTSPTSPTGPTDPQVPLLALDFLKARRVGAFCGLGNPESFWKLLEETGAALVWKHAFPDHYRPTAPELDTLLEQARRAGAEQVFITEKDLVNLPESWRGGRTGESGTGSGESGSGGDRAGESRGGGTGGDGVSGGDSSRGNGLPVFVLPAEVEFGDDTARFRAFLDRAAKR